MAGLKFQRSEKAPGQTHQAEDRWVEGNDRYRNKGGDQVALIRASMCHPDSDPKEKVQTTMSFSPNYINPSERKAEPDDSVTLTICFRL